MLEHYEYSELPQSQDGEKWIRILDLLPSTDKKEPIKVRLRAVPLDQSLKYNAVSYVWGDTHVTATVFVEDEEAKICGKREITTNLVEGLRVFRLPDRERTLWVDALCINQDSTNERSQQVGMMGSIYWLAERVLIWLGPDKQGVAGEVLKYMRSISQDYFHSPNKQHHNRARNAAETEAFDARIWSGIKSLYDNPWFERVWVQQEIGLADKASFFWGDRESCCHHDILGFDLWLEGAAQLAVTRFRMDQGILRCTRDHWISYGRSTREAWADDREGFLSSRPFLLTLIGGSRCKASDPRDHVYAFLGHPSARRQYAYRPEQQINYLKLMAGEDKPLVSPDYNKSVDHVFLETAIALFFQQRDMRVLAAVRHTEGSLARNYPSWVPRWDAIREQRPIGAFPFDSSPVVAAPDNVSPTFEFHNLESTDSIRASLTLRGLVYQTIDRLFDFNDGTEWLQQNISGRRFFRTKSEEDGLAPTVARPGDMVVLLLCSYAPCLLRHVKGDEYKFVGNCYVFGIMDRMSQIVSNDDANIKTFVLI
ncbi:hypothetical protein F5Y16DRAFT_408154 [Xylariaceae sp. FL0255]|nr:hypothetical protein F5Y16DRAFT_408154 [Xylariaceae sp. FL0255]